MIKPLHLLAALAAFALGIPAAGARAMPPIRVILVGDSTMAPQNGYGDALCARFTPDVTCINLAANGRSSSSFRSEGRWDEVLRLLRDDAGRFGATYVLVQFGHNDQPGKRMATDLVTGFPANMARYARETRALGGIPVLVTPLTRRTFRGPNLHDTLGPWAAATRRAAVQEHAILLDLNADSATAVQRMGHAEADTLAMEPPDTADPVSLASNRVEPVGKTKSRFDWTHLGPKGATYFGAMVAGELAQAVPVLAPYFKQRLAAKTYPSRIN